MPVTFTTDLRAPTNVTVDGSVEGEVSLSWSNPDDNPDGEIEIYRSTDPTFLGSKIADGLSPSTTSYTDTSVNTNTAYYYTIRRITPG